MSLDQETAQLLKDYREHSMTLLQEVMDRGVIIKRLLAEIEELKQERMSHGH